MFVIIIRTLILYILVVAVMRLMGKRQIGQLQPYELATAIMISELAAVPMQDMGIPVINGIIPILILLIAQIIVSLLTLKSNRMREIICGRPSILIENGKIIETNLKKELYNINDLLEQLRINQVANISDVEFAILETSGQLSVIPKSQKRAVTPLDLKISTGYEGLSLDLVIDGIIISSSLEKLKQDTQWLLNEFKKRGIKKASDVLFASIDTEGNIYYQKKNSV